MAGPPLISLFFSRCSQAVVKMGRLGWESKKLMDEMMIPRLSET